MKLKIFFSLFCGSLFGFLSFLICVFVLLEDALEIGLMAGVLFAIFLFLVLIYDEKKAKKRYLEVENEIAATVFYKANGNFNLGKEVRNGNIYFVENGIIVASFDQKPFAVEVLWLPLIKKYEFDDFHINIYTQDGRKYLITTTQASEILNVLKERKWVVSDVGKR